MVRLTVPYRRAWGLLAASAVVAALAVGSLVPGGAGASSHREAPQISGQPQFDNTDVYAFVSPDRPDTVTLMTNVLPFQEPAGGPNFYPFSTEARYDLNVDNDGDARPDRIFRWTFATTFQSRDTFLYNTGQVTSLTDPDLNLRQTYQLEMLEPDSGRRTVLTWKGPVAPSNVGTASMPNYQALRKQATVSLPHRITAFAGQADDPFFADLRVFDLLYGGDLSEVGNDSLAGLNVNTLAVQVPTRMLTSNGDPVIGVWASTSRRSASGGWAQVSRLGMPLVNEVVVPLRAKDLFNASRPDGDARFLGRVTDPEVPKLIEAIYGIKAPATPRNDLVQVFLTGVPKLNQPKWVRPSEQLRLNTSIRPAGTPERLGVLDGDNAGFPNGRRLTDDAIDVTLQAAEGELVGAPNDLGDGVDANDVQFGRAFPYVGLPTAGSATQQAPPRKLRKAANVLNGGAGSTGNTAASSRSTVDEVAPAGGPATMVAVGATGATALGGLLVGGLAVRRRRRRTHLVGDPFTGGPVTGGPVSGGPVSGGPVSGGPVTGGPGTGGR